MRFNTIEDLRHSKERYIDFYNYYESLSEILYPTDIFVDTIINRAISINAGFNALTENPERFNYIAAAPLIRLQIDNLIYCYAGTIADDILDFCKSFLEGKNWNKLKDRYGNEMKESYILDRMCSLYKSDILRSIYQDTSSFVHFSASHIKMTLTKSEEGIFQTLGEIDVPGQNNNLLDIMFVVNNLLERILNHWAQIRIENKNLLLKLRQEHPDMNDDEIFASYAFNDRQILDDIINQVKTK